jgi:hypothetical protein
MNSVSKAEDLFNEVCNSYSQLANLKPNDREIRAKEEFVRFFLKQERYEVNN